MRDDAPQQDLCESICGTGRVAGALWVAFAQLRELDAAGSTGASPHFGSHKLIGGLPDPRRSRCRRNPTNRRAAIGSPGETAKSHRSRTAVHPACSATNAQVNGPSKDGVLLPADRVVVDDVVAEGTEEYRQRDPHFQTSERGAETVMDTAAEGD